MPIYPYKCDTCKIQWEVRISMSEHNTIKNAMLCPTCKNFATQIVAPLNFRLKGEGWFGNNADAVASAYCMTQTEIDKNLDEMNKIEDYANTMSARDENIQEL